MSAYREPAGKPEPDPAPNYCAKCSFAHNAEYSNGCCLAMTGRWGEDPITGRIYLEAKRKKTGPTCPDYKSRRWWQM